MAANRDIENTKRLPYQYRSKLKSGAWAAPVSYFLSVFYWSGRGDLNTGPPAPKVQERASGVISGRMRKPVFLIRLGSYTALSVSAFWPLSGRRRPYEHEDHPNDEKDETGPQEPRWDAAH